MVKRLCAVSLFVFLIFLIALPASAGIYKGLSYQGRLLNLHGEPVADGSYDVQFTIWNHPSFDTEGNKLWSSGYQSISVSNGLFSYVLGSDIVIPDSVFTTTAKCYLGIQLSGDAEILPRTRFVASGFAFYAQQADSVTNDPYLNEAGDTLSGNLAFSGESGEAGNLQVGFNFANLKLATNGENKAVLWGQDYGSLELRNGDGDINVWLNSTSGSGGELYMRNEYGNITVSIDADESGNDAVELPNSSVGSYEMYNEPGVSYNNSYSYTTLKRQNEFQTAMSLSITTPSSGYVVVHGMASVYLSGTTGTNVALIRIDNEAGGTDYFNSVSVGAYSFHDTAGHYYPVHVHRVFQVSMGMEYTFYMEGRLQLGNDVDCEGGINNKKMTAVFYPTSYGDIKSVVSDPTGFEESVPIELYDDMGNSTGEVGYEVDLRELELKARQKRIEALEAELELKEARERIENE